MFIENEYPPQNVVFRSMITSQPFDDLIEKTQAEIKAETGIDLGESAVGTGAEAAEGAGAIERVPRRARTWRSSASPRRSPGRAEPPWSFLVDRIGPQGKRTCSGSCCSGSKGW
ncbi:MAG: hypothetical protein U0835_12225 [Isosphaeraceae bacterium]